MVDIWMLHMMLYPFLTVSVLAVRELMMDRMGRPRNSQKIGNDTCIIDRERFPRLEMMSFLIDKGLPNFITGFVFIYWTSGIVNSVTADTNDSGC